MIIESKESEFEQGKVPPTEGGCWFCHKDDGEMSFDMEFDTYYHSECLEKTGEETILDYESSREWT